MHAFIGEGNGNPLQCSCLENPRDRGAWWAAVYGVAHSWTRLKRLSSMNREDWWATVHGVAELDMTEWLTLSFNAYFNYNEFFFNVTHGCISTWIVAVPARASSVPSSLLWSLGLISHHPLIILLTVTQFLLSTLLSWVLISKHQLGFSPSPPGSPLPLLLGTGCHFLSPCSLLGFSQAVLVSVLNHLLFKEASLWEELKSIYT